MSQQTDKREAWEIALEIKGEFGDKAARLLTTIRTLESRIERLKEVRDEYQWLIKTADKLQKRSANVEWIEGERESFQEILDEPNPRNAVDTIYSPPRVFKAMVELCDAILAERQVTA